MGELGIACRPHRQSSGGYAKNPLWLRATVDAIGLPVELLPEANLTIDRRGRLRPPSAPASLPDLFEAAEAVRAADRRRSSPISPRTALC